MDSIPWADSVCVAAKIKRIHVWQTISVKWEVVIVSADWLQCGGFVVTSGLPILAVDLVMNDSIV